MASDAGKRRTLRRLLYVTAAMFGFAYSMVPLYNVFCEVTGLNGKTGRMSVSEAALAQPVDSSRTVTVEFIANVNENLPWEFRPKVVRMQVHPGEFYDAAYVARNLTDHDMTGQAVPSVTPNVAAAHFNKVECFCFTEQRFKAGEGREMGLRFMVDPKLPEDIGTVTLSYTFFDKARPSTATAPSITERL
jgi:cytochrome c oxidase assembly protein subunit 11